LVRRPHQHFVYFLIEAVMSGRVFFTPQAGRTDRSKQLDDEPWGTTSSQSHFKAYEPSEARSARSSAVHVKPALEGSVVGSRANSGTQRSPTLNVWERHREDYRDPSARSEASAVTVSKASSGSRKAPVRQGAYIPAAELVAARPIPERPFRGVSHYKEQLAEAQEARHEYFPYRDEYHPRSKRLLYEMALNKVKADHSDRSTNVVDDDTRSCFTLASSAASAKSRASRVSAATSLSRASSMPSINEGSRLPTGDSLRVSGGFIGSVAKRRSQAMFRSPGQWEADRQWFTKKLEEDGPAGLMTGNFPVNMYEPTMDKYGQFISAASGMLSGEAETLSRKPQ